MKRQLRSCPGMKFGLIYRGVLRLTLPDSSTHRFEDLALAADFINKNVKTAVVGTNGRLAGFVGRLVGRLAGRLVGW